MKPYIYNLIDEHTLFEILNSFQVCTSLFIQLIDENGQIIISLGTETSFCQKFQKFLPADDTCEIMHCTASKRAISLGSSYIFSCHSNLNHIVYPIIHKKLFLGSVLVGPFLIDQPDSTLITDLSKHYEIPNATLFELYDEIHSIPVLSPSHVTNISKLLYYLVVGILGDNKSTYTQNQSKLLQQSKINESIQMYKEGGNKPISSYPYEKEKRLISSVKTGNVTEAKALLNDLLGYVFFAEGSSISHIKSRSIELCALLSRAAIEGGASTTDIFPISSQFLQQVYSINSLDELCIQLQYTIETFIESLFHTPEDSNNKLVINAIRYINEHCTENLSLSLVADKFHISPAYLSTIFKQNTTMSFKEYSNMIKIEEGKRLLLNTNYAILDIAISCGFEDQSYFSKVFKKYVGITPKQFRDS